MVRSAATRTAKFNAKLDGDIWNLRITAQKDDMVEQINARYAEQAMLEQQVKNYLEPIGMYGTTQHHYMNYAQELWARSRMFASETLRMEIELIASKWLRRGLEADHLIRIAQFFGVTLTVVP